MTWPDKKTAALWYAQKLHWPVFPVFEIVDGPCACGAFDCDRRGKHPRTPHGFKDASKEPAQIVEWWTKWPDANIGLATGEVSGVDVLDIDRRACGNDSLWELECKYGELPPTVMSMTGGGGAHIFASHIPGLKNQAGRIGDGLDFKTTGGYVILPPSNHASGHQYEWGPASRPGEIEIATFPDWLLKLIRRSSCAKTNGNGTTSPIPEKIPKGRQHQALVSFGGYMRRRGADNDEIFAALMVMNEKRM